jgi:hypothetical protein
MTLRKIERDSMGVPVDDTPSPVLRQIRQEEDKNAQARAEMTARRMRRRTEEIRTAHLDQSSERSRRAAILKSICGDSLTRLIRQRHEPDPTLGCNPGTPGTRARRCVSLRQAPFLAQQRSAHAGERRPVTR